MTVIQFRSHYLVVVDIHCTNHLLKGVVSMKCHICPETTLLTAHREGIEIDYCPNCRGVWLDRGELDKIIERSMQDDTHPSEQSADSQRPQFFVGSEEASVKPVRKSYFSELFDF